MCGVDVKRTKGGGGLMDVINSRSLVSHTKNFEDSRTLKQSASVESTSNGK